MLCNNEISLENAACIAKTCKYSNIRSVAKTCYITMCIAETCGYYNKMCYKYYRMFKLFGLKLRFV